MKQYDTSILGNIDALKVNRVWSEAGDLPGKVIYAGITMDFELPQEPVDTNTFIGTTLILKPITCSLTMNVYHDDIQAFKQLAIAGNFTKNGFMIRTITGTLKNMWIQSMPIEETPANGIGFTVNLKFTHMIFAIPKTAKITGKAMNGGAANTKNNGKKLTKKSLLKQLLNMFNMGG